MSGSFLDMDVPRVTWRTVILWGAMSPVAVLAIFFIVGSEGAAAWVQAVGSILAIFAAIGIANYQWRVDSAARERAACLDDHGRATELYYAVYEAARTVKAIAAGIERGEKLTAGSAYMFEQMLARFGLSFNGELCAERVEMGSRLRYDLTVMVIALRDAEVKGAEITAQRISAGSKYFDLLLADAKRHLDQTKAKVTAIIGE